MAEEVEGPAPDGYDRTRRLVGLLAGPAVLLLLLALPLDLPRDAHRLAAVFGLVIVFWITEAIPLPVTALLGPALAATLGVASPIEAFRSFGHPILFLFIGSFLLAEAMKLHRLDRRIALFVLSRRWVGESPARIMLAFGLVAAFLSMWMSNTATTAMMLPIGIGVLGTLPAATIGGARGSRPYACGLMLMIAYSGSVGGIATPVGTPPNLIAIGMFEQLAGQRMSFVEWMRFGLPTSMALFLIVFGVLWWLYRTPSDSLAGAAERIREERAALGPWSMGERASLAAFLLAVFLWIAPGVAGLTIGAAHPLARWIRETLPHEGSSAILAASLLFLTPIDRRAHEFALDWRHALQIDWGTVLLFGGGLSLGALAFSTGLAKDLSGGTLAAVGALPLAVVALLGLFLANGMTELMSNTAMANLLIPMFLALAGADAASGQQLLPAIAVTIGCSLAFCLPVATPPNAIVYGSGRVPLSQMLRAGILLDVGCGLVAWLLLFILVR